MAPTGDERRSESDEGDATEGPGCGSAVAVRPVASRRDLRRFVDFPYAFYRENRFWAPPLRRDVARALDPRRSAFFEHGRIQPFLAEDAEGRVLGRVAAIVNGMHLEKHADGNGFFGFFESVEREDVAVALLEAACRWLSERGLSGVRGPANPSLNDVAGLLVRGFDREPSILMPYNPPYHEGYLLRFGFRRAMTMWAYYVHKKYVRTEKLRRGVELVHRRNPGLRLRNLDMRRFEADTSAMFGIFNDAWSSNWGHVPMTPAEMRHLTGEMRQVIDPSIVFILEKDGEPVAFSVSLPDVNRILRRVPDGRLFPFGFLKLLVLARAGAIHECRTALMGVLRRYQGRGFDAILNLATIEEGPRHGYDAAEMSWVLDSNLVLRNSLDDMGAVIDKEYALFEKRL